MKNESHGVKRHENLKLLPVEYLPQNIILNVTVNHSLQSIFQLEK